MRQALTMDMLATDLADYLVRKGVHSFVELCVSDDSDNLLQIPFRETHHISGRAVALAESRKCQLNDLTLQELVNLSDKFTDDVRHVFDFEASVERRESIGGTSLKMVERQISVLRTALE
jgi:argininosuccinate lyase